MFVKASGDKVRQLENKGIVLQRAWFERPDINTGETIIWSCMRIIPWSSRVYIGPYKPGKL